MCIFHRDKNRKAILFSHQSHMIGIPNPWSIDQHWASACQKMGTQTSETTSVGCRQHLKPCPLWSARDKISFHRTDPWYPKVGCHYHRRSRDWMSSNSQMHSLSWFSLLAERLDIAGTLETSYIWTCMKLWHIILKSLKELYLGKKAFCLLFMRKLWHHPSSCSPRVSTSAFFPHYVLSDTFTETWLQLKFRFSLCR